MRKKRSVKEQRNNTVANTTTKTAAAAMEMDGGIGKEAAVAEEEATSIPSTGTASSDMTVITAAAAAEDDGNDNDDLPLSSLAASTVSAASATTAKSTKSQPQSQQASKSTSRPPIYEVEDVVDRKRRDDASSASARINHHPAWLYRVRWKGYGPSEDTWEPSYNLNRSAKSLLRQFQAVCLLMSADGMADGGWRCCGALCVLRKKRLELEERDRKEKPFKTVAIGTIARAVAARQMEDGITSSAVTPAASPPATTITATAPPARVVSTNMDFKHGNGRTPTGEETGTATSIAAVEALSSSASSAPSVAASSTNSSASSAASSSSSQINRSMLPTLAPSTRSADALSGIDVADDDGGGTPLVELMKPVKPQWGNRASKKPKQRTPADGSDGGAAMMMEEEELPRPTSFRPSAPIQPSPRIVLQPKSPPKPTYRQQLDALRENDLHINVNVVLGRSAADVLFALSVEEDAFKEVRSIIQTEVERVALEEAILRRQIMGSIFVVAGAIDTKPYHLSAEYLASQMLGPG